MTTPSERTRNLLQAGAFLKELQYDETQTEEVRRKARGLLRHYPTVDDVKRIAACEARACEVGFPFSPLLAEEIEERWFEGSTTGPHTG